MGLIDKLWKKIVGAPVTDLFFAPLPASTPGDGVAIAPDDCYVELYVESLRLEKARRFATRFHGVVYTFVTLAREGAPSAQLAAISKPAKLAELDKNSVGKVIAVHKQMMGPIAWRGGSLGVEVGLFSIKSGNLLSPVIDFVTRVSDTAGISFVGSVKPFLPLLTEGLDMIAGQRDDTNLEVGVDTSLALTRTGTYAVIDAPKGTIDAAKLSLDRNDGKLLIDGRPLEKAYCVFSIRRQDQKADYGEIPALKEKWEALQLAIRKGIQKDAEDALAAFRFEVIASQDLITSDAARLIQRASDKIKLAFGGGGVSKEIDEATELEPLSAIGLYD